MGCNTEVGFPLQGIFPTQGSNLYLLQWQMGSLPLSHHRSPVRKIKEIEAQSDVLTVLCFYPSTKNFLTGNEVSQTLNFPPWRPTLSEEAACSLDLFPPMFSHWVTLTKNSKRNCYFHWIPFHAFLIMHGRQCVSG